MPTGTQVEDVKYTIPALLMQPEPPETAATSSGLLPGYIGPFTTGTVAPVSAQSCRVAAERAGAVP